MIQSEIHEWPLYTGIPNGLVFLLYFLEVWSSTSPPIYIILLYFITLTNFHGTSSVRMGGWSGHEHWVLPKGQEGAEWTNGGTLPSLPLSPCPTSASSLWLLRLLQWGGQCSGSSIGAKTGARDLLLLWGDVTSFCCYLPKLQQTTASCFCSITPPPLFRPSHCLSWSWREAQLHSLLLIQLLKAEITMLFISNKCYFLMVQTLVKHFQKLTVVIG